MKVITVAIFLFFSPECFSQNDQSDREFLYSKKFSYNPVNLPDTEEMKRIMFVKKNCHDFIISRPNSNYKFFPLDRLGSIFELLNNTDSALICYKALFSLPVIDKIGRSTIHRAAEKVAEIYLQRNEFDSSLFYLGLAKSDFLLYADCGNAHMEDRYRMTTIYADCMTGKKQYQKAIDTLAPLMFSTGWARNNHHIHSVYKAYLKLYSPCEIADGFIAAINSLFINKKVINNGYTYFTPVIKIFNQEVKVYFPEIYKYKDEMEIKSKCIQFILSSEIYRLAVASQSF